MSEINKAYEAVSEDAAAPSISKHDVADKAAVAAAAAPEISYTKAHHLASDQSTDADLDDEKSRDIKAADSKENAAAADQNDDEETSGWSAYCKRWIAEHRFIWHLFWWSLATAYWIALLVVNHKEALVTSLLWAFVTGLFFFAHVPTTVVTKPIGIVFDLVVVKPVSVIPKKFRGWVGTFIVVAALIIVSMATSETDVGKRGNRLQSLLGVFLFNALVFAFSAKHSKVNWRIPIVGVFLQFLLGLFVTKSKAGYDIFRWLADKAATLLGYSSAGTTFVFGETVAKYPAFAVGVFPAIILFATLIQMLYYVGAVQWFIKKFAWFMVHVMDTSGSESVVAAASPFIGQGESALLIEPFVEHLTKSEIHSIMTSGFATISGSVLNGYIRMGVDAQTIITSCVMSVPCSLGMSKLRLPETEESLTRGVVVIPEKKRTEVNILHCAGNGAAQGLKLVGLIMASLIAITSLLALVNGLLGYFGGLLGFAELSLEWIFQWILYPWAWLIGVPGSECLKTSRLLAIKIFSNEFIAYDDYANKGVKEKMSKRGQVLTEYALCGFANFSSIGIQIGTLGAIAPTRKRDFAALALSAMLVGTMSTLTTAAIAGALI
ncbi:hypothetical protein GQ42DRAFT_163928 [Ramicandelaber brevisporus]|nr:hypothetical protein GQ42DRAFT_163928 [Ramicandelaber brevisporus]